MRKPLREKELRRFESGPIADCLFAGMLFIATLDEPELQKSSRLETSALLQPKFTCLGQLFTGP
jgi:hypothetical protein